MLVLRPTKGRGNRAVARLLVKLPPTWLGAVCVLSVADTANHSSRQSDGRFPLEDEDEDEEASVYKRIKWCVLNSCRASDGPKCC